MTDLTQVKAVTIPPVASVDEANQAMIRHGVRSLFVIGEAEAILGIVTSIDILGEKPIQVSQERGLGHAEVLVQQVMTPAAQLEAVELRDVQRARVGDIVETLKRSGRQHALVIDGGTVEHASTARTVRGIFSLSQIAKQWGCRPRLDAVRRRPSPKSKQQSLDDLIASVLGNVTSERLFSRSR